MATETPLAKKSTPRERGKVRFDIDEDGKMLAVHLDRRGFRRLLETLERLAATGSAQRLEKSGRARRSSAKGNGALSELVFHINEDR